MITLSADNRILTENAKYSNLVSNYASGVSAFSILNATDGFSAGDYLLLGNIGSENAEIVKIATVNTSTGAITTTSATKFSHAESTRVTILQYNQVGFYWTVTETFATTTPLVEYEDIHVSDWYTTYNDDAHSTGYGWFVFYNETTTASSQESNSLPYAGFDRDSVEDILSDFFSLLNNKELKLVTRRDALSWFNEGYSRMRNRLNMTNAEYSASELGTITTTSGTYEYDLPSDFYQLISISSGLDTTSPGASGNYDKDALDYISLREAFTYKGSETVYYIRGKKIGFLPTPNETTTYHYMYLTTAGKLTSNSETVDLPDQGFYVIKDFMMYRAKLKFSEYNAASNYLKAFEGGLAEMTIASIDRDANLDSWGSESSSIV